MIKVYLIVVLILFSGCEKKYEHVIMDINSTSTVVPHKLAKRYKEYWENFSDNKFDKTYKIELPYLQFIKNISWYKNFRGTSTGNFSIEGVAAKKIDDNIIHIRTKIISNGQEEKFYDRWIFVNNVWYHYYYPSLLPPDIKEYRKRFN